MSTKILTVRNLTVRLKYGKILILDNVSFELFSGDVLCIDGLNGSGKSTLLRIICGQLADYVVESGEIIYHPFSNKSILNFNDEEMLLYHSKIGYVAQKDNYDGLNKVNIEDLIEDVISTINLKKSDALNLFEHYFGNNKRISLKSIPSKLSGGEQRMVSIFIGLVCKEKCDLMIIDEPLNNLDFENVLKVSDLINKVHRNNSNSGLIIITHCKIITCVNRQRILKNGSMEEYDSEYKCHHCMGEPDCDLYYLNNE